MTESPESTAGSNVTTVPAGSRDYEYRDRRLNRALAWVGIVAGVVFTVAVIFFSGLALGRNSVGHYGWHRGYQGDQMAPGGCPMMRGGMMGPGDMGPGMMRPSAPPPPSPPAPTPR